HFRLERDDGVVDTVDLHVRRLRAERTIARREARAAETKEAHVAVLGSVAVERPASMDDDLRDRPERTRARRLRRIDPSARVDALTANDSEHGQSAEDPHRSLK